jgi:hypothetical protein
MEDYEISSIQKLIIPDKLICNSNFYKITITDSNYIIKGFEVYTKSNKIEKIKLNEKHPNCNPDTKEFCIPSFVKGMNFNDDSIQIITNMLKIFNFQSSYYNPWCVFELINDYKGEM